MARQRIYQGDPYWIVAGWKDKCYRCGQIIPMGAPIFYYPNGRRTLCNSDHCGGQASRDFQAAAQDEAMFGGVSTDLLQVLSAVAVAGWIVYRVLSMGGVL